MSEFQSGLLGEFVSQITGGGTPSREVSEFWNGGIPWVSVKDLASSNPTSSAEKISEQGLASSASRLIPAGTPIVATRMAVGRSAVFATNVAINQDLKAVFPNEELLDKRYLFHFLSANESKLASKGTGSTVKGIRLEDLEQLPIFVPPLPEQKKIAEILSGIDCLLHSLTKQNQKLETTKAALSKELITGLSSCRKDSLYGQIPEHWHESTLGEVVGMANLQTGPFGSQLHADEYTNEGIPVVMPQDMKKCRVVTEKIARITPARAQSLKKHRIAPGDILFSRRGDIGRHALISSNESDWICGTGCLRVRTNDAINPGFLSELLRHRYALEWLNANAVGQTMLNLNTTILSELPVVVPPKAEQSRIANTLRSIDIRSSNISDQIALVQQLKTAISSDLLSGRKRVTL